MYDLLVFLTENVFINLNDRQRRLIMLRQKDVFGFGENTMTLKAIGEQEGITGGRIRDIICTCKRKIDRKLQYIAAQKAPHVIVKKVTEQEIVPNLPMTLKYVYELGELSVRNYNCLRNGNLLLIDDLLEKTEADLLRVNNYGRKSLWELKELLAKHGLKLREYISNDWKNGLSNEAVHEVNEFKKGIMVGGV